MQNPLYLLQNATFLLKQCYVTHLKRVFCFQMTNTDHFMSRHSKHRLNTDVLNGKHYYEMGNHQYEGLIRSIMSFHVQCYCTLTPVVKYNCIMFLLKYKTTHKYTVTTKLFQ